MRLSLQPFHCIITAALIIPVVAAQFNETTNPTVSPTTTNSSVSLIPPVPIRACYSNLTEIEILIQNKDPFIDEEYVLCPNTTFRILDEGTPGFDPLVLRPNIFIKCGDDGVSTNNCVLKGGVFQVFSTSEEFQAERKVGIVIQGVTFDSAFVASALLVAPGDVTFIDCIFQNHKNTGVIQAIYTPENELRHLEKAIEHPQMKLYYSLLKDGQHIRSHETPHNDDRAVQVVSDITLQVVTFENCLFLNNSHGPIGDTTKDGIITSYPHNDIVLRACVFLNNNYTEPALGNGYAVSVDSGQLTISDSCFIDNQFFGEGVILALSNSTFNESNNYGTSDEGVTCQFALVAGVCLPFSSDVCTASNHTSAPNAVPTAAPTNNPSIKNETSDSFRRGHRPNLFLVSMIVVAGTLVV